MSLGSFGVFGFTRVRTGGHWDYPGSWCSLGFELGVVGFAVGVVAFIWSRCVHLGSRWVSLGSSGVVEFARVRAGGR